MLHTGHTIAFENRGDRDLLNGNCIEKQTLYHVIVRKYKSTSETIQHGIELKNGLKTVAALPQMDRKME